jgi:hypothetical protein
VSATNKAEWVTPGGSVERLGNRRSPVDDEGTTIDAGDRQPTNVERLRIRIWPFWSEVNPTETQGLLAHVELGEASECPPHDDVSLCSRLEGAPAAEVEHRISESLRIATHRVQARVGEIEECLLFVDVSLRCHPTPEVPGEHGSLDAALLAPCRGDGRQPASA